MGLVPRSHSSHRVWICGECYSGGNCGNECSCGAVALSLHESTPVAPLVVSSLVPAAVGSSEAITSRTIERQSVSKSMPSRRSFVLSTAKRWMSPGRAGA